jgi:glycosyltransferase involved in cell wall biosynthesis
MRVSFIITSRNEDPAVLDATLAGLHATTSHVFHEIVIVDDGSRAPVAGRATDADLRVIRNAVPIGVCRSRRLGASTATGDVFVWLDAHMSFGEGWLEQMLMHADARAIVCSPFWSYDLEHCLCWGADFVWNGTRDYGAQRYPGFGLCHRTAPPPTVVADVPMMIGACYMMRRDAHARLGGFSPHFRVWGVDEQDVSARAWMAGMRVRCATGARVGHLSRATFPYPVHFEHLEFNQRALIRTLFEPATVRRLEAVFDPSPPIVESWLGAADLTSWRERIQALRVMSDAEFLARFVPELARADGMAEVANASALDAIEPGAGEPADVST